MCGQQIMNDNPPHTHIHPVNAPLICEFHLNIQTCLPIMINIIWQAVVDNRWTKRAVAVDLTPHRHIRTLRVDHRNISKEHKHIAPVPQQFAPAKYTQEHNTEINRTIRMTLQSNQFQTSSQSLGAHANQTHTHPCRHEQTNNSQSHPHGTPLFRITHTHNS